MDGLTVVFGIVTGHGCLFCLLYHFRAGEKQERSRKDQCTPALLEGKYEGIFNRLLRYFMKKSGINGILNRYNKQQFLEVS
jgi:hypothetical protein